MRFDWYQASIPNVPALAVMEALSKADYYGDWEQSKPIKGYDSAAQFVIGDQAVFRINYGGQNEQFGPNVLGSGANAPKLAEVIRSHFPEHRVSRVDACEDFHSEKIYDYLRKKALKVAKEHKVSVREIVKPLEESDDGRTLYLGSTTSSVSGRIYEKGKQLGLGREWVRAEIQVRPQKLMKDCAAKLTPLQVWGMANWSVDVAKVLGKKDLQKIDVQLYQPSDHDRAYRFCLKQYRRVLERMLADHGSPEAVGAQIFYDLARIDEEQEKAVIRTANRS